MKNEKLLSEAVKLSGFGGYLRLRLKYLPNCFLDNLRSSQHIGINQEREVGAYAFNSEALPSLDDMYGGVSIVGVYRNVDKRDYKYGELMFTSAAPFGGIADSPLEISVDAENNVLVTAITSVSDSPTKRRNYPTKIIFRDSELGGPENYPIVNKAGRICVERKP